MFPGPTELWLFDRLNLDPKIQIKYIDTKNQLADILTNGNFPRDEWNHLLCLFNISHFSSSVCSETMAKRLQHDSGEERVTAKSRRMMSLVARVPSNVSSTTSVSTVRRSHGNQKPWSTNAEKEERPGRPVVGSDQKTASDYYHEQSIECSFSARYSKRDDNHTWSSQEWKLILRCASDRGNPLWLLGERHENPNQISFTRNPARWSRKIRGEWDKTSWSTGGNPLWPPREIKATAIYHRKRWYRIIIVNGIKIIRKQGEWSSAKKTETIFDECYRKRRKNILWYGECSWL